ncbi:MAG: 4-hydroxythreonine-4-phosphate dehydrogenase PdxA [Candidatus Omnitrophica bacterium]|nr:4-hydroxythreonine-4-phosphate dehydrogenase PdxA [Candidatus Omnitrophota bacterium]
MRKKPGILITTGDPKGIGPEVVKKALKDPQIRRLADFFIIEARDRAGFDAIEKAVGILKRYEVDGLVTAPVNKAAINKAGIAFKGHTEYLAGVFRVKKFAMMFCRENFRVSLVTRHVALKNVAASLSRKKIRDTIILTEKALREDFRIKKPRICVCGLNPHCGENGLMGDEEKRIVGPIVAGLRSRIQGLEGPLPADVAFYMAHKARFDAVVAMYHDQGLGPFKMIAFEDGVNVTLGLPFVRTSPDHGTAYDIAGKGIANPASMKAAIRLAVKMCIVQGALFKAKP